jgi:phosphatidylserine decarboxylase
MSAPEPEGVRKRLLVMLQYCLPQHFLSLVAHELTRSRTRFIRDALIRAFVDRFDPDMSDAERTDPLNYDTFNAFFTRALRPNARPIDPDPAVLVSPVDGSVSQVGRLDGTWLLQAKGRAYTLESLLATNLSWQEHFRGGAFATLYLAPFDYHRVHMPLRGRLRAVWHVPGQLFSVNAATTERVPALFARNERVVCVFGNEALTFAVVLVGALLVGSIGTVWHGEVTPRAASSGAQLPLDDSRTPLELEKGAELGRFNMGSTVILLLPPGRSEWLGTLAPGSRVRVGQALGRLT